ncbi:MAG: hypothetical protein K2J27_00840, partial [Duncaniella sp.]|nr:hypothetical protein [Duncaniella sp.]
RAVARMPDNDFHNIDEYFHNISESGTITSGCGFSSGKNSRLYFFIRHTRHGASLQRSQNRTE